MSGNYIDCAVRPADMFFGGIEVGNTDIRDIPELFFLTTEDRFDIEIDQYRFDRSMDVSFESEVCWEEFGDALLEQWEHERFHARLCMSCVSATTPLEPWAKPGFLWALHTGGAEIDSWFNDKRTERECTEALGVRT